MHANAIPQADLNLIYNGNETIHLVMEIPEEKVTEDRIGDLRDLLQ